MGSCAGVAPLLRINNSNQNCQPQFVSEDVKNIYDILYFGFADTGELDFIIGWRLRLAVLPGPCPEVRCRWPE